MKGFTLPVWVAGAAVAALRSLLGENFEQKQIIEIPFQDEKIEVPVKSASILNGNSKALGITYCESALPLDLTRNLEIWVCVEKIREISPSNHWLQVIPGFGVGKIKSTGDICMSSFAMELLELNLKRFCDNDISIKLEIIFPDGNIIASRTSNSSFGIVDGLAVIGTQAVPQTSASPDQLNLALSKVRSLKDNKDFKGSLTFVIGENGLDLVKSTPLAVDPVIKVGNWLGPLIVAAAESNVSELYLFGYHGKLIKLAGGIFHTHNHLADARKEILVTLAIKQKLSFDVIEHLLNCDSIEKAFIALKKINSSQAEALWSRLAFEVESRTLIYLKRYIDHKMHVGSILFDQKRALRWAGPVGLRKLNSLGINLKAY